jgi:hypothetical protein
MNWTTKDGRSIPMSEMTDQHLVHALNMLLRQGPSKMWNKSLELIVASSTFNGEMAQDACMGESDWVCNNAAEIDAMVETLRDEEDPWEQAFQGLVKETKKRGLFKKNPENPMQLIVPISSTEKAT